MAHPRPIHRGYGPGASNCDRETLIERRTVGGGGGVGGTARPPRFDALGRSVPGDHVLWRCNGPVALRTRARRGSGSGAFLLLQGSFEIRVSPAVPPRTVWGRPHGAALAFSME